MFDSFGLGFIVLGRGCLLGYCSLLVLGVIGVFLFVSIGGCWLYLGFYFVDFGFVYSGGRSGLYLIWVEFLWLLLVALWFVCLLVMLC